MCGKPSVYKLERSSLLVCRDLYVYSGSHTFYITTNKGTNSQPDVFQSSVLYFTIIEPLDSP